MSDAPRAKGIAGAILGTAVGDALGLPREGLSPRRAARLQGVAPLRHRLVFGRGMCSDDTEHMCLVGQALLAAPTDPAAFARSLAWGLRGWLLGLPAGIGFATLRALLKLWLGFPPHRSGVFSAGNGPAMRAPLLGACLGDTPRLRDFVRASTRLTHTDPRAEEGALLVARAAALGSAGGWEDTLALLRAQVTGSELDEALERVGEQLRRGGAASELATALGLARGVTGYVNHTVPVVVFCWLRWPGDYRSALEAIIALGGDADTTGAILGGVVGAEVGAAGIPGEWLDGMWEWPRSVAWMRRLAARLGDGFPAEGPTETAGPLRWFWPAVPLRNLLFLTVVLGHGFRRLLPPY